MCIISMLGPVNLRGLMPLNTSHHPGLHSWWLILLPGRTSRNDAAEEWWLPGRCGSLVPQSLRSDCAAGCALQGWPPWRQAVGGCRLPADRTPRLHVSAALHQHARLEPGRAVHAGGPCACHEIAWESGSLRPDTRRSQPINRSSNVHSALGPGRLCRLKVSNQCLCS